MVGLPTCPYPCCAMIETSAALRYYTSLVGRWEGSFRLQVTDRLALRRRPTLTRWTGFLASVSGPMRMRTTLEAQRGEGATTFFHTTEVSSWGVTSFTTEETITLDDDGVGLAMTGVQRVRLAGTTPYESRGSVDESGTRATYHLTWLGGPLVQRTRIVPEGLELTQDTDWSRGEVLLVRRDAHTSATNEVRHV